MDAKEVQRLRMLKFRPIGKFLEGIVVEPDRKHNMKPPDVNTCRITNIEAELQDLKKTVFEAKGPSDPLTEEAIEKIEQEVDQEITDSLIEMGLEDKIESLRLELSKASSSRSPNQPVDRNLKEKVDKIMQEFNNKLSRPAAYPGLKQKLQKLGAVNRLINMKVKQEKLKAEINQKVSGDIRAKIANLKNAQEKLSNGNSVNKELVLEAEKAKTELEEVLRSANLEVVRVVKRRATKPTPDMKQKMIEVNYEIFSEIDKVLNLRGLKEKFKELEDELAKGGGKYRSRYHILSSLDVTALKDKIDGLKMEVESKSEVSQSKVGVENGRH